MPQTCLLTILLLSAEGSSAMGLQWVSRSGTVELFPKGSQEPLPSAELPRELEVGDRLRVGRDSSARLAPSQGAPLVIGPDSDLTLRFDGASLSVLMIESGSVRTDPDQESPLSEEPQFPGMGRGKGSERSGQTQGAKGLLILKTVAAEVSSRDASFTMNTEGGSGLRLAVLAGNVQIRTSQGRQMVKAGQTWAVPDGRLSLLQSSDRTPSVPSAGPQEAKAGVQPAPSAHRTGKQSPQDIDSLLDAIHEDPDDAGSRQKLKAAVMALYQDHKRRHVDVDKPLAPADRRAILRRTYANMAAQIEDEAVQTIFGDGQAAFEKGHYLLTALHMALCRLMNPAEVWLRDAVDDYLEQQIPSAIETAKGTASHKGGNPSRSIFEAIKRRDWRRALQVSEDFAGSRGTGPVASKKDPQMRTLLRRLGKISSGDPMAHVDPGHLLELLRSADSDPEESVEMIEHILLLHHAENREPWWQKAAEGLRRAYGNRNIARTLDEARKSHKTGDLKGTMGLLVRVLQKSPGNPQALGMLEGMQARARTEEAKTDAQTAGKPRVVIPDIKDIVQSEAYYNRGLRAYVQGDLKGAAAEWRTSVKLYSANERSQKALARVLKEIGGSAAEAAQR